MSLIADALKAAQREKAKRAAANEPDTSRAFFNVGASPTTQRRLDVDWRKLALPVGAVIALLVAGWGLNALLRNNAADEAERSALLVDTTNIAAPSQDAAGPYLIEELDPAADEGEFIDQPVPAVPFVPRATAPEITPEPRTEQSDVAAPPVQEPPSQPTVQPMPGALRIEMQPIPLVGGNPLVAQALAAYNRRDYAGARDYYERALASGIASPEIYNNLGTAYRNLGDLARAEQAYQSAIALNDRSAPAWSNLGVVLYSLGRKREATAAYQQAIALDPSNASTKVNLAILYVEGAVFPEAKKLLEEALATAPMLIEAHYTYAQVLESMKDVNAAIRHYEAFLSISGGKYQDLERRVRSRLERLKGAQ